MQVAPEVSELDFTNAITASGFVVPSLTTRRVSTTIELADGQSFAIAGLLREDVREIVSKYPVLGDIPILGTLFRSSSFKKNETELIVIVTAHLVKPLDMTKQTLPTDQYIEPNDFEFYLQGSLEGKEKASDERRTRGEFWTYPTQIKRSRHDDLYGGRKMKRFFVFVGLLVLVFIFGGCARNGSSRVEEDFGNSFRLAKEKQILNPEAGENIDP